MSGVGVAGTFSYFPSVLTAKGCFHPWITPTLLSHLCFLIPRLKESIGHTVACHLSSSRNKIIFCNILHSRVSYFKKKSIILKAMQALKNIPSMASFCHCFSSEQCRVGWDMGFFAPVEISNG